MSLKYVFILAYNIDGNGPNNDLPRVIVTILIVIIIIIIISHISIQPEGRIFRGENFGGNVFRRFMRNIFRNGGMPRQGLIYELYRYAFAAYNKPAHNGFASSSA